MGDRSNTYPQARRAREEGEDEVMHMLPSPDRARHTDELLWLALLRPSPHIHDHERPQTIARFPLRFPPMRYPALPAPFAPRIYQQSFPDVRSAKRLHAVTTPARRRLRPTTDARFRLPWLVAYKQPSVGWLSES
jgi:hypothetical protein